MFVSAFNVSVKDPTIDVEGFIELLYRATDGLDCEDITFQASDNDPQQFELFAITETESGDPIDAMFIQDLIGRGSDDIGYFFDFSITPRAGDAAGNLKTVEDPTGSIAPLDDVEQRILSVAVDMYHEANEDEFDEDEIESFVMVLSTIHDKIAQANRQQCFPGLTVVEQGLLSDALDVYVKQSEEEETERLAATIASLRQRITQSLTDQEITSNPETLRQNQQTVNDATETESVKESADRGHQHPRHDNRRGRGGYGSRRQRRRRTPVEPPAVDDCVPVNDIIVNGKPASAPELMTYRQPGGSIRFVINGYDITATVKHEGETVQVTIPSDAVVDGFVELFETGSVRFETQEYKTVFRVENMDGRGMVSVLFFGKQSPTVIRRTMTAEEAFHVYGFGMTAIHNDIAE